jgi:hypothetical protein
MADHRQDAIHWAHGFDMSTVPDDVLFRESAVRLRARQTAAPRAKVFRQCPHCFQAFGARDLRAHLPSCRKRGKPALARADWKLTKGVGAKEQETRNYRYWQGLPPGDRIVATWDLTEAAYSIKEIEQAREATKTTPTPRKKVQRRRE